MQKDYRDSSRTASRQTVVEESGSESTPVMTNSPDEPFSKGFWDKDPGSVQARKLYTKILVMTVVLISLLIWAVLPMFWGSQWKPTTAIHNLNGWVVDFDGGNIGQTVTQYLESLSGPKDQISWQVLPASNFPNGPADMPAHIVEENCWVAVVINPQATTTLNAAAAAANSSYNGSLAVTMYAAEARNENSYDLFIQPMMTRILQNISNAYAVQYAKTLPSSGVNVNNLLTNAPQVITAPLSYTIDNVRPFDVYVATAVDFVGLIYLLILSFIAVMMSFGGRVQASGLERRLTTSSLIKLRLAVPPIIYFPLSLNYALVSLAFQVPFDRRFGRVGFFIFWMLAWCGMMALGMAVETMITLLTIRFIPFFLVLWLITNVSVCFYPIEMLPTIFRYGYATPFYNVSRSVRTIIFGTRNQIGFNFGVLFAWILVSCVALTFLQYHVHRRATIAHRKTLVQDGEKTA